MRELYDLQAWLERDRRWERRERDRRKLKRRNLFFWSGVALFCWGVIILALFLRFGGF